MSDNSITIVPKRSDYPDRKAKAQEILNWLVENKIVDVNLSDCVLSNEGGYAISDGANLVTNSPDYLPFDLKVNGLSIITERNAFDTGGNGIEQLICPNCNQDIVDEDWELDEWYDQISDNMNCPACNTRSDVQHFQFIPEWGFSNLGFTFWNWPDLTGAFIVEFKEKLGCEVSIVYQHI